ncbi:STAS domain-containing protein [Rhodoferax sp.]|uniref:STAS domain-containing protein n=1 Tax=Rhodoferax sp. TaxID=50421 RepID=UPI00374CBA37
MSANEPSGLLSKVVKFVRNPTTNWSDLDQPELDKESQYSKQMLKDMIERKRRNDFVRRREFDQLRKLRQREVQVATEAVERPSFFQSSMPSKLDDRAGTIKKIDEIEAQMSKQWWKAKDSGSSKPVQLSNRASLVAEDSSEARAYAATVPATLPGMMPSPNRPRVDAYAPTDVAPLCAERRGPEPTTPEPVVDMLAALDESLNFGFVTPEPFEFPDLNGVDFEHNPDLEEAAIRFANGDVLGAESALQALVKVDPAPDSKSEVWLALFDLYRATNQQDKFDTVGIDFATRFGRSGPAWFSIPDQAGETGPADLFEEPKSEVRNEFSWACPHVLSASAVTGLQASLRQRTPSVVHVGWTRLGIIDSNAVEELGALLADWAGQSVQLSFVDADRLEELVRSYTRTGDATVNQAWWRVRLDLLRIQQCPDAFDMVALEYCITYEVSPPSWQEVRCTYKSLDADGDTTLPDALAVPASGRLEFKDSDIGMPTGPSSTLAGHISVLNGLVLGDASDALAAVDAQTEAGGLLVVSCDHLMRIDFSAAGSVLNWAAVQQADGRSVQFTGLHRLAAIFFNVIGINEYAKVIPRRN